MKGLGRSAQSDFFVLLTEVTEKFNGGIAQLVERLLCKQNVTVRIRYLHQFPIRLTSFVLGLKIF